MIGFFRENIRKNFQNNFPNLVTTFRPKIFRSEISCFVCCNKVIKFMDFKFLASTAKIVRLENVQLKNSEGSFAKFNQICEAVPNVKEFR